MTISPTLSTIRRKAVWGPKRTFAAITLALFALAPNAMAAESRRSREGAKARPGAPNSQVKSYKLDDELSFRADRHPAQHTTRVIVEFLPGGKLPPEFKRFAKAGGRLNIINGQVMDLPNGMLKRLAAHPDVFRVHYDRKTATHNYRTDVTVGARIVQHYMGYTGAGIGVAVIDSGVATWHDDLTNQSATLYPYGNQRVAKFVDFVNGRTEPYDDNGHGSHIAGTIAGNGYDSFGQKAGVAPNASLVSLKVLDANGQGTISSIIAALDWIVANHAAYNIRVVNMSVGASIHESYWTDPLTLATKRVTDLGITVVAAAGNLGKNAAGQKQFGGITAPGNAPWVLTVGASSTMGTLTRIDDTMASYSSRGPTYKDFLAKPDLVAPGTGTVSLAVPGSTFYATKSQYLVAGSRPVAGKPYLSLSGTSMATPVVSGTVALMLQANPTLTPNLIKGILQYTAQVYPGYKPLEQGAGFLNTLGAVRLARFYATATPGARMPVQTVWSRRILWGNHLIKGGYLLPGGNAWDDNVVWGSAFDDSGDNIVWGSDCADGTCDNIVWGSNDGDDNIVWGSDSIDDNIVWGSECTDAACDNIVWGNEADENIVWGSDCGGADCDNIVWGSADDDNIVWGSAEEGDNIVWGSSDDDNIVWGTSSADGDVTWGSSGEDAVVFSDEDTSEPPPDPAVEFGEMPAAADPAADTTTPSPSL